MGSICRVILLVLTFMLGAGPSYGLPQLLLDMRTGEVLFEKDAGHPWHPASLTKLMTAYSAFEAIAAGRVTLDTPVVMSENALKAPPSKMGFPVGTAVTLEDALYLMIVKSANDVATAIGETVAGSEAEFVDLMNWHAANLGLTATRFANAHGLHDPSQITSARDIAILAFVIRSRYPQYDEMFETRAIKFGRSTLKSYNILLEKFRGTTGMKTGYVCASGLNIVATAKRNGRELMAVVFGGVTSRERGELAALLLERGFQGRYPGTRQSVTNIVNRALAPPNMRPQMCGAEAKTYLETRKAAFPFGLEGQISYLNDVVPERAVRVTTLGTIVDVDLPRPRPAYSYVPEPIALPRPRPATLP
ncbi:D-alanyl-D-alanine carboxypeptidase family protein [Maritalea mediterranea]|uniref:D-alanyl-D-alanine carboxypeptidase n=1 Tax=Maritalea mediterranea TaxID=2909667 RepID=A0ABS9ECF0_9HYPH|nr:D-alanyl-D-alanine carboxypeptidase family protein [Maritalea mediterranea]MCF4099435.1 D-alanyl-D-alanine carboxypeptidase [Maritalea mediterranea]